jgi:hypothetical protein
MQSSSFGTKKLAPCKNFSWLLNRHLKMAPGDFSGSYFLGARAASVYGYSYVGFKSSLELVVMFDVFQL